MTRSLRVTLGSEVEPRRIEWWHEGLIPRASLTLLAGREGLGKSTIAADWAAQESRSGGVVLYVHTEDSREHTVVPRLAAAGAELSRVMFVDVETETTCEGSLILPLDSAELERVVDDEGVTMLILDAATSTMASQLSGRDDREVRQYLEPLAQLASRRNLVVVGLVHFGKRDSSDTGKLILGSIAWSQVARSVLSLARDPEGDTLVLSATKSNFAPSTTSLALRLVSANVDTCDGPAQVGRVEWLGHTDRNARDLLGDRPPEGMGVDEWLREFLADGPVKSLDVYTAADANSFSKDQAKRASKRLGVEAFRDGQGPWYWRLGKGADAPAPLTRAPFAPLRSSQVRGGAQSAPFGREHAHESAPFGDKCALCGFPMTFDGDLATGRHEACLGAS